MGLALQLQTAQIRLLNLCKGGNPFLHFIFLSMVSICIIFYTELNSTDYLDLKLSELSDLTIIFSLHLQITSILAVYMYMGGNLFLQLIVLSLESICVLFID